MDDKSMVPYEPEEVHIPHEEEGVVEGEYRELEEPKISVTQMRKTPDYQRHLEELKAKYLISERPTLKSPAKKRRIGLHSTPQEKALARNLRGNVDDISQTTGSALLRTGKFMQSWSNKMPEVLPATRYVLTGRSGYDAVYNELENVFGAHSFTTDQAVELLATTGFDKKAVKARLRAFITTGAIVPELAAANTGKVEIIPKTQPMEIIPPPRKSLADEIFSASIDDITSV